MQYKTNPLSICLIIHQLQMTHILIQTQIYGPITSVHTIEHLQYALLYKRQQQSFLSAQQQSPQCQTLYQ